MLLQALFDRGYVLMMMMLGVGHSVLYELRMPDDADNGRVLNCSTDRHSCCLNCDRSSSSGIHLDEDRRHMDDVPKSAKFSANLYNADIP